MSTGWTASTQDTSHFYSDYYAPGGDSGCQAAGPNNTITALSDIASAIVGQFTVCASYPRILHRPPGPL